MKEQYKISELIAMKVSGIIEEKEKDLLDSWLLESEENKKTYSQILAKLRMPSDKKYFNDKVLNNDWQKVFNTINLNKKRKRLQIFYMVGRVAAVFCICAGLSYLLISTINNFDSNSVKQYAQNDEHKESPKAILVLEDGKQIDLTQYNVKDISQSGVVISMNEQELVYNVNDSITPTLKEIYNTIIIPKAGEYSFMLADGTKVWVNSDTKLRYPVKFLGDKRVVYLEGEAYFEVRKNEDKPFIVKTFAGVDVEVLGTRFNVEAYKDSEKIKTTLVAGKVDVSKGEKSHILTPNQQLVFNMQSNTMVKKEVDAYMFVAWKDGKFLFENEKLETIMMKLSRWYNVEVFYMNQDVKDFHFTGDMERYEDISTILKLIEESTDIKFRIKEKTIIISNK